MSGGAPGARAARKAAASFTKLRQNTYLKALASLVKDPDDLSTHYLFGCEKWRKAARSTNAIERCFVEVRHRTRPMGVMADKAGMSRILYAVFTGINQSQGTATLFPLTHKS